MRRASVVFAVVGLLVASLASAGASPVVISQVYGGGGNSGAPLTNDFVELFNRGPGTVSLTGMSVQYASATGTGTFASNPIALLSGSLGAGQYYLIQMSGGANGAPLPTPDATATTNMSAGGGKVALVNSTTGLACNGGTTACTGSQIGLILDLVGLDGANFYETAVGPTTSNTTAALRQNDGCTDTDNNSADFAIGPPIPRNTASPFNSCGGATNPSGVGAANPASVPAGGAVLLTVAVTAGTSPASTGLAVTADLTTIGGPASQAFFDDGTNGDATAGDNVFSFQATVAGGTTAGAKTLPVAITDAQLRTGSASITLTVESAPIAIHDIQGAGVTSPFDGDLVATTGIVTGIKYNGFFFQTPDAEADNDPDTSEGIFVFTSSAPAVLVGDNVRVSGTVQEYVPSADRTAADDGDRRIAYTHGTFLGTSCPRPSP
jgi:predicted extracellular nuclease